MYGDNEPMPVDIDDLETLVSTKPKGTVATKLKWDSVAEEEFERLIFALVASEPGYENAAWLTKTQAPDRGRDVSVFRVQVDSHRPSRHAGALGRRAGSAFATTPSTSGTAWVSVNLGTGPRR
jgi:hypothetical protein